MRIDIKSLGTKVAKYRVQLDESVEEVASVDLLAESSKAVAAECRNAKAAGYNLARFLELCRTPAEESAETLVEATLDPETPLVRQD